MLEISGGRLFIEVCVTHACDKDKADYFFRNRIDCIEYFFPLSEEKSIDEWIKAIESNRVKYKWHHHSALEAAKAAHLEDMTRQKLLKMAGRRARSIKSLKKSIALKKIFLPDIYQELTVICEGITFNEQALIYNRRFIRCDEYRLVSVYSEYALAEATLGGRVLSIIYAFSDNIPLIENTGERSVICRYYPSDDNKPLWVWLKHPPMVKKISEALDAFSSRCNQLLQQRKTLLQIKHRVERLTSEFTAKRDAFYKRDYGLWKQWMIKRKLFTPSKGDEHPSIPSVLKLKRDNAALWPFQAWDVLIISVLADTVDGYPVNFPVPYNRFFSTLAEHFGALTEFHQLSRAYQTINIPTTYDTLIDTNEMIKSALFPFYNMNVVTLNSFSLVRTASLTALLRLQSRNQV